MTEPAGGARRKRRRASRASGPPQATSAEVAAPDGGATAVRDTGDSPAAAAAAGEAGARADPRTGPRRAPRKRADTAGDRGLRDLVGAGPSQVGPIGAARARDMDRPTDDELLEAERAVQIVRRNWRPPS